MLKVLMITYTFLHRWTLNTPITAENTAVAVPGLEDRLAIFTFIEKHAGIHWHSFSFFIPAFRAGNCGLLCKISSHAILLSCFVALQNF